MIIALCDDEKKDRKIIELYIKTHHAKHTVIEFTCATILLEQINSGKHYDLLFLDVQMPNSCGWKIAKLLKESKIKTYIVMVTVLNDYIRKCFDRVDWFIAKPVSEEDIHTVIDSAYERLFPMALSFKSRKINLELTAPEIWHIEVKINDVYIYTINDVYKIRKSLKEVKEQLTTFPFFVQVHQSFIINLEHYNKLCGNEIILKNNHHIPLSRGYRAVFLNSLAEYIKGNLKYERILNL
ncbi:MAG: LytTR family DNA-binding domain-containing protein [Lachnospiraceae bacterium]|nr:LytTR family DNA-binding domain-containing protein [Lachnospiraceae bacterium]